MKKVVMKFGPMSAIALLIVLLISLVGCVNYKANDTTKKDNQKGDADLVSEIAAIEKQLETEGAKELKVPKNESKALSLMNASPEKKTEEKKVEEKKAEEVVLPKLDDANVVKEETDEQMQTITVKENDWVRLKATISDPDKDLINYSYSKPLSPKGEWKTEYGDAGEYLVILTVTDGKLSAQKKIKIVVQRVNVPPVIEQPVDLMVKEGGVVKFAPKAKDPNGDPVTVTISDPLKSGTFATDHTSAGEYKIKVTASDGELQAEKSFKLTVKDVNVPPLVENVKDIRVKEGEVIKIEPKVTDLDNDKLTVTISDPVGNDGIWKTTYIDHGEYPVTITASDGKDTVTKKIKVTVQDVNMPPQIIDVSLS